MADPLGQCILPPSPNWYCSSLLDCSLDSLLAFGARNGIFVYDITRKPLKFRKQLEGHRERVTAVQFCKKFSHRSLLVSGGEDLYLKLWDATSGILIDEHDKHPHKVTAVSWSYHVTDLIASGDEAGNLITWYYGKEEINQVKFHLPPSYIFSLQFSPHQENQLAVGFKNGSIAILQIRDHAAVIVHHLKGHEDEVQSVSWCPAIKDQEKDMESSHLLASGSKDRTIRVWDTAQGRVVKVLKVPQKTGAGPRAKMKIDDQGKSRVWINVCWNTIDSSKLISSSLGGDLLQWELESEDTKQAWSVFQCAETQGHSRCIFNVACSPDGKTVVTNSMDRQIILWDLPSLQFSWPIYTIGGFVYALASSTLDPRRMAVGVGDSMIRVWDILSPHGEALVLWQGIKAKVMTLSWHPTKEGLLAYGTEDGRVGIYNLTSQKPEISSTYHKKAVYSLSWGPQCQNGPEGAESVWCLYSCSGDGVIFEHIPGCLDKEAVNINNLIQKTNHMKHKFTGCTEVAWDMEGSLLAIGHEDGAIEIYSPPLLKKKCNLHVHNKSITCLSWHPGHTNTTGEKVLQSCRFWLASGSNESVIHVHDLHKHGQDVEETVTHSFRHLSGHSGRITKLSWSPHSADLIASSCYDGTAQVWNVVKGEGVCNFREHSGRVMSIMWSYIDSDVVYSGGDDLTVRYWRLSEQQHTQPPKSGKKNLKARGGKKRNKKKKSESEHMQEDEAEEHKEDAGRGTPPQETNGGVESDAPKPDISTDNNKPKSLVNLAEEQVEGLEKVLVAADSEDSASLPPTPKSSAISFDDLAKDLHNDTSYLQQPSLPVTEKTKTEDSKPSSSTKKKKNKGKSLFPVSAVADNKSKPLKQEECVLLANCLHGNSVEPKVVPGVGEHINLGLFCDRSGAYSLLASEGEHHGQVSNVEYQCFLEIWKGNLVKAFDMALQHKQLTDNLIALAPLGGQEFWQTMTKHYADQLAENGLYLKSSVYYLACHQLYDAIDVLAKNAMYREAIALAKVRLPDKDPCLLDLYCSWAKKSENDGSYEQAAKCFLAAGMPGDAARVLSRRGDASSFKTAAQVAFVADQPTLGSSLLLNSVHLDIAHGRWADVQKAVALDPKLKVFQLFSLVHEYLVTDLIKKEVIPPKTVAHANPSRTNWDINCDVKTDPRITKFLQMSSEGGVGGSSPWYPTGSDVSSVFLPLILNAWCSVSDLPQDTSYRTMYDQLDQVFLSSCLVGLDTVPQLLLTASYEITRGILSLLSGNIHQSLVHWLSALHSCYSQVCVNLEKYLCSLLLPRGSSSWQGLQSAASSIDQEGSGQVVLDSSVDGFSHFHAFYSHAQLMEMWWKHPRVVNQRGVLVPTKDGEAVVTTRDKGVSNGDCQEKSGSGTTVDTECMDSDQEPAALALKEALYSELLNVAMVLLSEDHAEVAGLRRRLEETQASIHSVSGSLKMDAVIREAESEKHKGAKKAKAGAQAKHATDEERKAKQEKIDKELNLGEEAKARLEKLKEEEKEIMEKIELHPLKDFKFPDPVEAALVITNLAMRHNDNDAGKAKFGIDVTSWALRHAYTDLQRSVLENGRQHFNKLLAPSKGNEIAITEE